MTVYVLGVRGTSAPDGGTGAGAVTYSYSHAELTSSEGTVVLGTPDLDILMELQGLGPAPRTVQMNTALGLPGKVINRRRPVVDSERRITGPLYIRGETAAARAALQSEVLRILAPPDDSGVTFSIFRGEEKVSTTGWAAFDTGSWEVEASHDAAAIVTLDLICPDSYWSGATRTWSLTPTVAAAFFPILPATITTRAGLGDAVEIATGGDVPTWPTLVWSGPGSALEFETEHGTWRLDLDTALTAGQTVTVRTDPRAQHDGLLRIEGPSGESYWEYLTQRGLRPLAPGTETIMVTVEDSTSSTSVDLSWAPRWRDVP